MRHALKLFSSAFLFTCMFSAQMEAQDVVYREPFRPQVHFSPQEHWNNDPNGLVFYKGEYHLFFQYNPFGREWGHMSWGHAVSKDLLHWQQLPVAIPEHDGVMIFTGSVVVDSGNTSGLCSREPECLVAVYTGSKKTPGGQLQNQNLAFSLDNGRTWTQHRENPVLDLHLADFRDPSVFWDKSKRRWIMAVSLPKEHKVSFYASPNLRTWTKLSDFGPAGDTAGEWECPDLLQIPSSDGSGKPLWALKVGLNPGAIEGGSGEQFFVGAFDGKTFSASTAQGAHGWTNYGKDDYCAIHFNNLPAREKPILMGWMSNWQYAEQLPTAPWRGQMSLPRQLTWFHDQAGLALQQKPVVSPLRVTTRPIVVSVQRDHPEKVADMASPVELNLVFSSEKNAEFGLRVYSDDLHWTEIGFDRNKSEFYIDRTHSGLTVAPTFPARTVAPLAEGRALNLTLVLDRSSVEAYAQKGTIAMTDLIYPPSSRSRIEIFSKAGSDLRVSGEAHKLRSIWRD